MPIEITWPQAGRVERKLLDGRGPFRIGRSTTGHVVLDHPQVSRLHVEVTVDGDSVTIEDKGSQNGTRIDGRDVTTSRWSPGQTLQIGPFRLGLNNVGQVAGAETQQRPVAATPTPGDGGAEVQPRAESAAGDRRAPAGFPGALFDGRVVAVRAIQASGKLEGETEYLAIGGGCGSFCWVDHLRIYGVPASAIRVIGVAPDKRPYAKWGRLCRVSQIPEHERIRSNSISTPDNIWGFPGYASREFVRDIAHGRLA